MFKKISLSLFVVITFFQQVNAQSLTQTIRGTIIDKVSNTPLPGATVVLMNSTPLQGTTTDMDGNFKLSNVTIGKQTLQINYLGYKEQVIPNVIVNSGKEVVLNITLEENYVEQKEVVITAKVDKTKALNEMTMVSARTFSVEEIHLERT